MITPRIPAGTLELLPYDQIAFNRMVDVIRHAFERYGFLPVATPTFEATEALLTKTGGETERQVYFVESTGALEKSRAALDAGEAPGLPELALRFDLTVPLARYVAQHEAALSFPFRRYQIQPAFRGERPQRGRFREFIQCDVDIIGKGHLDVRYDAEPVAVVCDIYRQLGFGPFTVKINNRRLLRGLMSSLGITDPDRQSAVLREVDKLDKRGMPYLLSALGAEGLDVREPALTTLTELAGRGIQPWDQAMVVLAELEGRDPELDAGIGELRLVAETLDALQVPRDEWAVHFGMVRGLDYYTGTIYETQLDHYPELGSVAGGGRYANLAGLFTKSELPGVGISIGLSRLFWQLSEAGLAPKATSTVDVLVTLMDDALRPDALALAGELRRAGLAVESVMEPSKLAKQFKQADRAGVRWVAVVGEAEVSAGTVTLKDLHGGDQVTVPRGDAAAHIRRTA